MQRCSFTVNGQPVEADESSLHLPAAEFIRNNCLCKSIKVSCAEGGCGACAVEVVQQDPISGGLSVVALNSCLTPVSVLHGCHVITSEGLGNSRQGFHEVQVRLAGFHGTQCGFCSPGIAVSCHAALTAAAQKAKASAGVPHSSGGGGNCGTRHADGCCEAANNGHPADSRSLLQNNQSATACPADSISGSSDSNKAGCTGMLQVPAAELLSALDGNLCRCTGWRPIADMAKSFASDIDIEDLGLNSLKPQQLGPISHEQLLPAVFKQPLPQLPQQQQQQQFNALVMHIQQGCVLAPASMQQLLEALQAANAAHVPVHLLAGNTGAGIYKSQWQASENRAIVLVHHVQELKELTILDSSGVQLQNSRTGSAVHYSLKELPNGQQADTRMAGHSVAFKHQLAPAEYSHAQQQQGSCTLVAGGAVTLTGLLGALKNLEAEQADQGRVQAAQNLRYMCAHISRIAGTLVRNAATLGGHLALAFTQHLESDLLPILIAAGAEVELLDRDGKQHWNFLEDCLVSSSSSNTVLQLLDTGAVITAVHFPLPVADGVAFWSSKLTTHRRCNEHAIVNMACWLSTPPAAARTRSQSSLLLSSRSSNGSGSSSSNIQFYVAVGTYQPSTAAAARKDFALASTVSNSQDAEWQCVRALHVETAVSSALQQQEQNHQTVDAPQQQQQPMDGLHASSAVLDALRRVPELLFQDIHPAGRHADVVRSAAPGLLLKGLAAVLGPVCASALKTSVAADGHGTTGGSIESSLTVAYGHQEHMSVPSSVQQDFAAASASDVNLDHGPASISTSCNASSNSSGSSASRSDGSNGTSSNGSSSPPSSSKGVSSSGGSGSKCLLSELQAAAFADAGLGIVVPQGRQDLPINMAAQPPLYWPTPKDGGLLQASGEAEYTDDIPVAQGAVYAAFVPSSQAYARLLKVDCSPAMEVAGVVSFVGPNDIPAGAATQLNKQYTGPDEPLFAYDQAEYVGQPLGLVVAKTLSAARAGAARVKVTYGPAKARNNGSSSQANGTSSNGGSSDSDNNAAAAAGDEASNTGAVAGSSSSSGDTDGSSEASTCDGGEAGSNCGDSGPLTTLAAAAAANSWYDLSCFPTAKANKGDAEAALATSDHQLSGQVLIGSQRHFYMEPQTAVATPEEGGRLSVVSSCQGCDYVLWCVAKLLKLRHNQVHVSCRRVGGGFGGKADRALWPAAAAAVAAHKLRRQVRLVVAPNVDAGMNAGRCRMSVDWAAGVDKIGQLQALKVTFSLTAGAFFGLTTVEVVSIASAVDSVYDIPAVSVEVRAARCHLPPHTTVRGPGKISAVIAIEHIMQQIAAALGQPAESFKKRNMIQLPQEALTAAAQAAAAAADKTSSNELDTSTVPHPKYFAQGSNGEQSILATAFGKPFALHQYTLPYMWQHLQDVSEYEERRQAVDKFNRYSRFKKRGLALAPVRYMLYHMKRTATVTIYADGSILLLHPGTEMGQGIATKAQQAAAHTLGQLLPPEQRPPLLEYIRVACGSTELMPHAGVAAGSTTSEAATAAVAAACELLLERLRPFAEELAAVAAGDGAKSSSRDVTWEAICKAAGPPDPVMGSKVVLTATARAGFTDSEGWSPENTYQFFGVGAAEVEVDLLTGERRLLRADLMVDVGRSVNPAVDLGQVEGAFMQGVGHVMTEEVAEDQQTGTPLTNSTWTYKPPGLAELPAELNVHMLRESPLHVSKFKQLSAKATGEPPLMLAAAVVCALQDAVAAAWIGYSAQTSRQQTERKGGSDGALNGRPVGCGTAGEGRVIGRPLAGLEVLPVLQLPATAANLKKVLPPALL